MKRYAWTERSPPTGPAFVRQGADGERACSTTDVAGAHMASRLPNPRTPPRVLQDYHGGRGASMDCRQICRCHADATVRALPLRNAASLLGPRFRRGATGTSQCCRH